MPNPKDFMPEGSTFVRAHVREGEPPVRKRKSRLPTLILVGCVLIVLIILLIKVGPMVLFGFLGAGVLWYIAKHPPRKRKQGKKLTRNKKIDLF
ncbi:hypothetical protein ACFLWC_05425 [Chloroflexota bacterium]